MPPLACSPRGNPSPSPTCIVEPLLQEGLEFAHVLEAQVEGLEAGNGRLAEVVAIELAHGQAHITLGGWGGDGMPVRARQKAQPRPLDDSTHLFTPPTRQLRSLPLTPPAIWPRPLLRPPDNEAPPLPPPEGPAALSSHAHRLSWRAASDLCETQLDAALLEGASELLQLLQITGLLGMGRWLQAFGGLRV